MNVCRLCLSEGVGYPSIYTTKSYVHKLVGQLQDVVGQIQLPDVEQWPTQICPECIGEVAGVINFCDKVKQTQLTIEARYGKRPVEVFQPETEEEVEELEVEEQEEEEEIAIPDNMDLLLTANGETVYEIKYMNEGGEEQTTTGNELEDLIIDLKASESRTRRSRTKVEPEVEEQMELDQDPSTETTPTRSTRRAKTGKQSLVEEESGSSSPSSDVVNKLMKDYGVLTCKLCPQEKTLQDFRKMKNHNSSEHDLEGVACCEKVFHSRVRLYEHVKYHVAPGDIKCETCHKHFKSQANLKTHMADHHADTMFGCTTCEFLCASDKILKRHQLSHLPVSDRSVACPQCDFRCHFASQLTTHTKAKHPDPSAKRDGPEHVCEECNKSFSTKGNLTSHIKALHDLNTSKVECGQCGKMVRRLARHLSICQNKQQLKCPHCPNIHPNQHALNTHILRMHKKDLSKLTCEVCNKVLSRESHLREHMATHTKTTLYNCQYCNKGFYSNSNMYKHLKVKHFKLWKEHKQMTGQDGFSD